MSRHLILFALLPILLVFNYSVFEKESLLKEGERLLLPLAPRDPRSLMQGDYMRLRYRMAVEAEKWLKEHGQVPVDPQKTPSQSRRAQLRAEFLGKQTLVFLRDTEGKARFVRLHQGQALAPGEGLLSCTIKQRYSRFQVDIRPDSFFFQEGNAPLFAEAVFGVFVLGKGGTHLLTGLADKEGRLIRSSATGD